MIRNRSRENRSRNRSSVQNEIGADEENVIGGDKLKHEKRRT